MPTNPSFPPHIESFEDLRSASGTRVFFSPDRYLLLSLKRSIISTAATPGNECAAYDAGEPGQARDAFGAAREVGFFGAKKIVVLDYAESIFPKPKDRAGEKSGAGAKKDADEEGSKGKKAGPLAALLEEAVSNPDPENLFILLFNDLDRRTKLFGLMNKKQLFRELAMPDDPVLRTFVRERFGDVRPDEALIGYFLKEEQRDLFFIENEIAKLRLWAESQGLAKLSLSQAEPLLSSLSDEIIFRLTDHLVAGKKEKAIALFRDLRVSEGDPKLFPILIMLFQRHFRVLMNIKVMVKKNQADQIPAMLFAHKAFYLKNRYREVMQSYRNRTIVAALREAARLELGMKGVYGIAMPDVGAAIEQFMLKYF